MPRHPSSSKKVLAFPRKRRKQFFPPPASFPDIAVPPTNRARLGILLFITSEAMLFAGLLALYLSLRFNALNWPPAHLYLPIKVTWVNSSFLFLSCYTMYYALKAGRVGDRHTLVSFLSITGVLGGLFLCIQGYEWIQILREGIMSEARVYGSTFYLLIGCHALHVLGAVIWLLIVIRWAKREQLFGSLFVRAELCGMYWYFVGVVWAILFPLVYLT